MKRLLLSLFLFSLSLPSFAKSTIVEVMGSSRFPYESRFSIYINEALIYIECRDEYLSAGSHLISDLEVLKMYLKKGIKWAALNRSVKADINKPISSFFTFRGTETGLGYVSATIQGRICTLGSFALEELLENLDSNLEKATREEAKNKQDLFN